jgi:hypothetical protein
MKTTHRRLLLGLLTFCGLFTCQVVAISQEVEGEGQRGGRIPRPTRVPGEPGQTPQFAPRNQLASQPQSDAAFSEPRDTISLNFWDLTISNSAGPESDELVGKLIDKANNLPTVIGTVDEVRDLISRLKAAGVMRKSREFRLLATNDQPVYAQSGASRPSVIASNFTPSASGRGGRRATFEAPAPNPTPAPTPNEPTASELIVTNSIQYREIGTVVEVIPRIDASGAVLAQFTYNASDIETSSDVPLAVIPGRKSTMADRIVTCQIRSTARLKSGTAVVVHTDSAHSTDGESSTGRTQLLILAASVQPVLE